MIASMVTGFLVVAGLLYAALVFYVFTLRRALAQIQRMTDDEFTPLKEFHHDEDGMRAIFGGRGAQVLQLLLSEWFIYGGGKNFIEWVAQVPPNVPYASLTTPEFIITCQRKGGLTPNEMRVRAEQQRDELVEQLVELFGWKDTSYLHASLHVKNAVNNLRADLSVAHRLLRRIREWDQLPETGDGPFWMSEIDAVLASVCPICYAREGEKCDAGLHS